MQQIPPSEQYDQAIVKIFDHRQKVIGTGFCVNGSYILTCAHVVAQSLGLGKNNPNHIEVKAVEERSVTVQPHTGRSQFSTQVISDFWRFQDEDIALLRLEDEKTISQYLSLQDTKLSFNGAYNHGVSFFGFGEDYPNGLEVKATVATQAGNRIQIQSSLREPKPKDEDGLWIKEGMSGAPAWDLNVGAVVGMVISCSEERDIGFMLSVQLLQRLMAVLEVMDLLAPYKDCVDSLWEEAYQFVHPQKGHPWLSSLAQAVDQMMHEMMQQSLQCGKHDRIHVFLAYLYGQDESMRTVQSWLQEQLLAADYDALLTEMRGKQEHKRREQQVAQHPYLLCMMQRELGGENYTVEAFFLPSLQHYDLNNEKTYHRLQQHKALLEEGTEKFSKTKLKRVIPTLLDEIAEIQRKVKDLKIEIFVNLDDLGLDIDCWPSSERPGAQSLGKRYQCVLRLMERWQSGYGQCQGMWDEKWQSLTTERWEQMAWSDSEQSPFLCGDGMDAYDVMEELETGDFVGFVLTQPVESYDSQEYGVFHALLETGGVVALWPRQVTENPATTLRSLLETSQTSMVLGTVQQQRSEAEKRLRAAEKAGKKEFCLGRHIGLVWDNPDLFPPIPPFQNSRLGMVS